MKIKTEILIDRYVAKVIAYLLNFFVRIVGKLLRIDHNLNREFKTIAICKFKGMGSILQSTPMIHAIRQRFPQARIIYVSTESNRKILEKIKWIDTIVTVDDKNIFKFIYTNIRSIFFLIRNRPDVYFDLEIYSDYTTLFTLFTLSVNRIGFYLRSSSFRMGIYTHMMFYNPRVPISSVYLQLAQLIGCNTETAKLYPLLDGQKQSSKEYIVINPNASDLRLERRWDKHRFMELIQQILSHHPQYEILLIGSKNESTYTGEIASEVANKKVKNIAGTTTIEELITIIGNTRLMISNDTGPMHIAFCTNIPVICLFGPCSPDQYGISRNAHIIYKSVYCSPCIHDFLEPPCKGDNVCMKLISVREVLQKTNDILRNPSADFSFKSPEFVYKQDANIFGKVIR